MLKLNFNVAVGCIKEESVAVTIPSYNLVLR